jgi:chorismate synthase
MSLKLLTAGESHGPALIAILEGFPAGMAVDTGMIDHDLERRQKGFGAGPRMKMEEDHVQILGGIMGGLTTGAPIALQIINTDHANWKGKAVKPMTLPRPGHADLTGAIKYGYADLRPALERASARETAARVAAGAICKQLLAQCKIKIVGYVLAIGGIIADLVKMPYPKRFELAEVSDVRCPDKETSEKILKKITEVIRAKNTLGGIIEVVALGVPAGLGSFSQWDQRLDARLGMAALSIQAIKGVEIGDAFENAHLLGTEAQDAIRLGSKDHSRKNRSAYLIRPTNRAGGIEGGISNGQPIVVRVAMKPIASTLNPQGTVDLATGNDAPTKYERSDFCPVPRAVPVVEAMVAFALAQALLEKIGGDSIAEILPRCAHLRRTRLEELSMDNREHQWWGL